MSDELVTVERDADERALERCAVSFEATLLSRGYSAGTLRLKRAMLERFVAWLRTRQIATYEIDETTVGAFLDHLRRRGIPIRNRRYTLITFLEHLRQEEVTNRPDPVQERTDESTLLLRRYAAHLREERGLTEETTDNYLRYAAPLVRERIVSTGSGTAVSGLDAQHIRDFLLRNTGGLRPTTAQLRATALRSFLRFLLLRGETALDLSAAVPSVRRWRKTTVHPYLQPQEVEQLLRACDTTTASGRRDHAILLLLARLGMRAREVAAMQLKDLRWRGGEILVLGKGRFRQHLPLLPEVGAAIALYLQDGRPRSPCRNVFLRHNAPRVGLGADAIGLVVQRALRRAGLHPPHCGSHLLRFSLATNLIRQGATMAEIGDVLRHRSPETTEIYAKVDFEALRTVALPWPTAGGVQ